MATTLSEQSHLGAGQIRIDVLAPGALSPSELNRWEEIQAADPRYSSPFLTPAYTQIVGLSCEGVRVAVLRTSEHSIQGFFPFQLVSSRHAKSVGTNLCDYQAVIATDDLHFTAQGLLSGCGLDRWDFDHLLADQREFLEFHRIRDFSPIVDLSDGFEAYARQMTQEKRYQLAQSARRRRQLEREVGPVVLSAHEPDPELLEELIAIKGAQWARSGWPNRFESPWERSLLKGIMEANQPGFGGMMTVLRAGGRVIALHLGMRSRTVWHYWITAYDPAFGGYSPGLVMLVEMIRSASGLGLTSVDLGKGNLLYKRRLMNGAIQLAEGTVCADAPP